MVKAGGKLDEEYGVDVDEGAGTDTERGRRRKREALLGVSDRVARY